MNDPLRIATPADRRSTDRRLRIPEYGVDRRGTAPRSEVRFLASAPTAAQVRSLAQANLAPTDLETPWYTTTYCDTADYALYRGAERVSGSLLRLREYHEKRPAQAFTSARIWIEWKDAERERSEKQRLIVRPEDVGPFLRGEPLESGDVLLGLRRQGLLADGLRPVVITQCRRTAFASRRDEVRITLDHELSYYSPEPASAADPVPCQLGALIRRESGILIELKWADTLPDWMAQLLGELRQRSSDRPSKFVVAMRLMLASRVRNDGRDAARLA